MFFFLGRAEWCSLPFSWDTKSSFIWIQNHFSGFFGKKRFVLSFWHHSQFWHKRVWLEVHFDLHFWHPALASLCLSIVFHLHIITLLRFKVNIKAELKCVSYERDVVKRSVAKIKIFDPPKLGESKQAKKFWCCLNFMAISIWSEIPFFSHRFFLDGTPYWRRKVINNK